MLIIQITSQIDSVLIWWQSTNIQRFCVTLQYFEDCQLTVITVRFARKKPFNVWRAWSGNHDNQTPKRPLLLLRGSLHSSVSDAYTNIGEVIFILYTIQESKDQMVTITEYMSTNEYIHHQVITKVEKMPIITRLQQLRRFQEKEQARRIKSKYLGI